MTGALTAIVEGGVLRPTKPLDLAEGTCVELIVLTKERNGTAGESPAEILAKIAALSSASGDARTSIDHDKVLYGERGTR